MSAQRTPTRRRDRTSSAVLDDDALENVRDVLAAIGSALEKVERFFPLDDAQRIAFFVEPAHDRLVVDAVRFVFEGVELDRVDDDAPALFRRGQPEAHLPGGG